MRPLVCSWAMSIQVICSLMVLLGGITNTALLTKKFQIMPLYRGLQTLQSTHVTFVAKKKKDVYVEDKMITNVNLSVP